jgi:amidohydrolase
MKQYLQSLICIGLGLSANFAHAHPQQMHINASVDKNNAKYVQIFQTIHQNPELGFMEKETASLASKELRSYGYKVTEKIAQTGIAAVMRNGDGPVVMYRADMDANAVKETTGLPYASKKVVKLATGTETPVAHACGHDAHVAWMLSTAKFMAENKHLWKGTVIFVGQPAEEAILGAEAMVKDGLYSKYKIPQPDYLFGMHTAPLATGMAAAAAGVRMAGTDQIDVTFHGIGGHGSSPNLSKDPIVMAASAIMQYQTIISRNIDPKNAAVLTVGSIQAGNDNNVIPPSALVKINLRWFNEKDRKTLTEWITRINEGIAHANNLSQDKYPTVQAKGWSYPLNNHTKMANSLRDNLLSSQLIANPQHLLDEKTMPSLMGSEDFHHLVIHNDKKNYAYLLIGIAEPQRFTEAMKSTGTVPFSPHNGNYEVDLAAIPFGSKVAISSMLTLFNTPPQIN